MSIFSRRSSAIKPPHRAARDAGALGSDIYEARLERIPHPAPVVACAGGCGILAEPALLRLPSGHVPGVWCWRCGAPTRPRCAEDDEQEPEPPRSDPRRRRINCAALACVARLMRSWYPSGGISLIDPATGAWTEDCTGIMGPDLVALAAHVARCSADEAMRELARILGTPDVS